MHKIIGLIIFTFGIWCSFVFAYQQTQVDGLAAVLWQSLSFGYAVVGMMGVFLFFAKKTSGAVAVAKHR
ncbi:hypothetical protein KUL113_07850 [Tenacibaculum sp. KUL113]|nr:hypothetical protein KUL113_07850 [Tenacibaculum sp. KUL113]